MECPKCKNPLSIENASVCEWCGNQLPTEEESIFKKIKRLLSNFVNNLRANKKRLIIFVSSALLIGSLLVVFIYYLDTPSDIARNEEIIPRTWQEQSAFDYLTEKVINSNEDFETLARKYSQDTLQEGYIGIKVNNDELPTEFDIMASTMKINDISPVFLVRGGAMATVEAAPTEEGYAIEQQYPYARAYDRYAVMKLLTKHEGHYTLQFITRDIELEIGHYYQGGIIFQLDKNAEHGLIAAEKDLGKYEWGTAKEKCETLDLKGYNDWHLPSKDDLSQLYQQRGIIGRFVDDYATNYYWSNLESDASTAWYCYFGSGVISTDNKNFNGYVRAIRAF